MTVDETILDARGNGKIIQVIKTSHMPRNWREGKAWPATYHCEVRYIGEPDYDFSERKTRISDAKRWFKTWSKLAA